MWGLNTAKVLLCQPNLSVRTHWNYLYLPSSGVPRPVWGCWQQPWWEDSRGQVLRVWGQTERERIPAAVPLRRVLLILETQGTGVPQYRLDRWVHRSETQGKDRQLHPHHVICSMGPGWRRWKHKLGVKVFYIWLFFISKMFSFIFFMKIGRLQKNLLCQSVSIM